MICKHCKVEIINISGNCPLCGKHLSEGNPVEGIYPEIGKDKIRTYNNTVRLLLFLTISLSISCYAVNMLTPYISLWSAIAIYGMWLAWLVVGIPVIRKRISPFVIILDDIAISIFLYVIDINTGNLGWSLDYAIPFVLCGSALTITIIVISARINWREFYLFEFAIVIICFIPFILRRFMEFVFWPSIVSAIYGGLTFLGIIVMCSRKLKQETRKRLHI